MGNGDADCVPGAGADLRRAARVALWSASATIVAAGTYPLLPGHRHVELQGFLTLVAVAAVATALVAVVHDRVFAGAHAAQMVYLWNLVNIGLVSAGVALTGGLSSPLYLCYALTVLFVASCCTWRAQLALLTVTLGAYLVTLVVLGARLPPGLLTFRLGIIAIVSVLGASIARDKDRNAAEADRRAGLLAMVASLAREVSGADASGVLEAVLAATDELGFEYAYVLMFEEGRPTAQFLGARGIPDEVRRRGIDLSKGLTRQVREQRATVWLADYAAFAHAIPEFVAVGVTAAVGSPVLVDGELVGMVAAGTGTARALSAVDKEAFELLAGVASRAFEGARRFELLAASEARMRHMALHDHLTGLANRALFQERLDAALAGAPPTATIGCIVLDLDDFKRVNDTLGHGAGDELLRAVARRLQECLRPTDTLARLSGDEFGVLVVGLDPGRLDRVAARILEALGSPIELDGRHLAVRASVGLTSSTAGGLAVLPERTGRADQLLSEADVAMYEAKGAGKGRVVRFDHTMRERMVSRITLEAELRGALEAGELTVVYQPILDLRTKALTGFEALARWHSARLGPVPPAEFVPLAEQIGAIEAIGRFVLRRACEDLQALRRANVAWSDLSMSVNLSTRQLADPALVEQVLRTLSETWTPSWCLTLELTESALLEDAGVAEERLEALAALGIGVALDDFGTGYSSLAYLRQLKVHTLKIDQSFVRGLGTSAAGAALVRSIVHLAGALGLSTVAEGVETPGQLGALQEIGCDRAQGFLLGRPLPAEHLAGYVAGQRVLGRDTSVASAPARPEAS